MTQSSFYSDTPNYATDFPTQNDDGAPTNGNAPAPSSFYQSGGIFTAIPAPAPADPTGATNTPGSFYGAAVNYAASFPTQNDSNTQPTDGNAQAPSSFYPSGGIYAFLNSSDPLLVQLQALVDATQANASAAATSASGAAASAASAASSLATVLAGIAAAAGTATPAMDGTATVGTSAKWAHEDHVHPTDTSRASVTYVDASVAPKADKTYVDTQDAAGKTYTDTQVAPKADKTYVDTQDAALSAAIALNAPLASPTFTGDPKAPTASPGDNDTSIATTAFVTAAISVAAAFPSGTTMLFYQAAAPTGWTKLTTQNDKALRVVSGSGGVAGGTNAFSTVMAQTVVGNTALTIAQMPAHAHTVGANTTLDGSGGGVPNAGSGQTGTIGTSSVGSGAAHNHTIIMAIQYIDLILASKN